jgi:hypothetical protein
MTHSHQAGLHSTTIAGSALLLFLALSIGNLALVRWLDNTNLETSNGLWKMPGIHLWEKIGVGSVDTGGLLYFPTYGSAARLLPDFWFTYGTPPDSVTHRKMAALNAIFGALASSALFLIACRMTHRLPLSVGVAGLHATAGFVLLNSVNSEDVIPAYALFVCMVLCLSAFLETRIVGWFVGATFFLGSLTFFHWTLLPPAAAALALALFLVASTRLESLWLPACALAVTAVWMQILLCITHWVTSEAAPIGLLGVIFPQKAAVSGWLGFASQKLVYLLVGIGNYWVGAQNVSDYAPRLRSPQYLAEMAFSLAALIMAILVCFWTLFSARSTPALRAFAAFGLALFLTGELMHLYSQPQDPQSQIQPMLILFVGLLLGLEVVSRARSTRRVRTLAFTLLAIAMLVGTYNVARFASTRSADSFQIEALQTFMSQFPPARTRLVSHGFEGWITWRYVFGFDANSKAFEQDTILITAAFTNHYGISSEAAADLIATRIADALDEGYRVYAGALWTQDEVSFVDSMSTVVERRRASEFYHLLMARFQASNARETPYGTFVELKRR